MSEPARAADVVQLGSATIATASDRLALLRQYADEADEQALASSTRRLYEADFAEYAAWCHAAGYPPLPADPEVVRLHLIDIATQTRRDGRPRLKPVTVSRHLAAISYANGLAGHPGPLGKHPRISRTMKGIRKNGDTTVRRRRPLMLDGYRAVVEKMEHTTFPRGIAAARDPLAIGIGFAAALRSSEAAALLARNVWSDFDGIRIYIASSKGDQDAQGATLGIPYGTNPISCVPCALVRWSRLVAAAGDRRHTMRLLFNTGEPGTWEHVCADAALDIDPGLPLLRRVDKHGNIHPAGVSGSALSEAVKRRVEGVVADPKKYSYHSLRSGFVTQARHNGASVRDTRRQTRHGSDALIDLYDRETNVLLDNGVTRLGL
jgi:integrase